MARDISNQDDVIDSRDVIARIEELQAETAEAVEGEDGWTLPDGADVSTEMAELKVLEAFASEAEGYAPDWTYGATLVRETYWTEYVQELLEDCGDLPKGLPHYVVIDWEATARNIRMDYTSVEFDCVTYWVR